MVDLNHVLKLLEPKLGKITESFRENFRKNVLEVFKGPAAAEIKEALLAAYDRLADSEDAQYGPIARNADPLNLKKVRNLFEAQISKELSENVRLEGDELVIEVMNKSDLGIGRTKLEKGVLSTVDFLGFYIEGFAGEVAFVPKKIILEHRPFTDSQFGRLGEGFLLPRKAYKAAGFEQTTGVSFEQLRHPISGHPPYRGFDEALSNVDYSKYINQALEETIKSLSNKPF